MTRGSFEKIKLWIFDLDNTLYHPRTKIFEQIDIRMKKFISNKLRISRTEAFKIQKHYYKKYGTTLFGLMKHYKTQPNEFLNFVHDVDLSGLKKCRKLFKGINKLPGKKIIYTNGDEKYAKKVLEAIGINSLFEFILDIKKSHYLPKPSIEPLINYLNKINVKTEHCVYFEDLEKNLENAHKIGIMTVHITEEDLKKNSFKSFIDFRFNSILKALDMINKTLNK